MEGCCQGNNALQRGKITHCFSFLWHFKTGRSPWSGLYPSVWHIPPAEPREVLPVKSFCCGIFSTSTCQHIYTSIRHKGHGDHGLVFSYKNLVVNLLLTWQPLLAKSWAPFWLVFLPWVSEHCGLGWSSTHSILAGVQGNARNESISWAASALYRLGLEISNMSGVDALFLLHRTELCFQRKSGPLWLILWLKPRWLWFRYFASKTSSHVVILNI